MVEIGTAIGTFGFGIVGLSALHWCDPSKNTGLDYMPGVYVLRQIPERHPFLEVLGMLIPHVSFDARSLECGDA